MQLGGGVRDLDGLAAALDLGVDRVILGTMAAKEPETALEAARRFPGRVVIGIDARDGKVAIAGWTQTSELDFLEAGRRFDAQGVAAIVFTDISRDGMHSGPNLESTASLCRAVSVPVIAAGGVHDIDDVKRMLEMEHPRPGRVHHRQGHLRRHPGLGLRRSNSANSLNASIGARFSSL